MVPHMADHTPSPQFAISIAGDEDAVRGGLAQVMMCLLPLGLNADDTSTVELVLAETLNNVVEHALAATTVTTLVAVNWMMSAA